MGGDREMGVREGGIDDLDEVDDDRVDEDEVDDDRVDEDEVDEEEVDEEEVDASEQVEVVPGKPESPGLLGRLQWTPLQLAQAAHLKQAVVTALAMGGVAVLTERPAEEAGVITLTVLVGQVILGWHNDIVDRERDAAHHTPRKPIADGRLDPGAAWYAVVVGALILVPLSITTGITAGAIYLVSVCVGMLGNVVLRTGFFSWVTWAISFALLPAYLSYGGWGGQAMGDPPETAITVLAAALGVGVHFMRAVWGLVADHEDEWTYLPLKLGLKLGASRLLALSTLYTVGVGVALGVVGYNIGLSR